MDFDKNVDQLYPIGLPNYGISPRTSGLQIIFTEESEYVEPWSLADFKVFARIDFDTDDSLLNLFLKSARITIENYLQKSLGIRKIRLTALSLPKNFKLPWGPVEALLTNDQLPIPIATGQVRLNQVFEYAASNTVTLDFDPTDMLYVALNGQVTDQWTRVGDQLTVTGWVDGYIIIAYFNGVLVGANNEIKTFSIIGDILKEGGTDVTVNYITNASMVNDSIKTAIYKQALEYYENRGAYLEGQREMGQVINEVRMILYPYKNIHFL